MIVKYIDKIMVVNYIGTYMETQIFTMSKVTVIFENQFSSYLCQTNPLLELAYWADSYSLVHLYEISFINWFRKCFLFYRRTKDLPNNFGQFSFKYFLELMEMWSG